MKRAQPDQIPAALMQRQIAADERADIGSCQDIADDVLLDHAAVRALRFE